MSALSRARASVIALASGAVAATSLVAAPAAHSAVGDASTFPLVAGTGPRDVAVGPDGLLYVTNATNGTISKVGLDGSVIATYVVTPSSGAPRGIVAGPDGNLWFVLQSASAIGKMTPQGTITPYSLPTAAAEPIDIAVGPDGNLWFTESAANKIGRITPQGVITEYALPSAASLPWSITAGPQGSNRLYFTQAQGSRVAWISTSGIIGSIQLGANANPRGVALINNAVWFAQTGANRISQVVSDTSVNDVPFGDGPYGLTGGPGGTIWVVNSANQISRSNSSGQWLGSSPLPVTNAAAETVTLGPDGNLWVPMFNANSIARVASGQLPTNTKAPELSPGTGVVAGTVLNVSNGTWQFSPSAYTYSWQRCTGSSPTSCSAIDGVTSATYTATVNDSGKFLRAGVRAINVSGSSDLVYTALASVGSVGPAPTPGPTPAPSGGPVASVGNGATMELDAPAKQKRGKRKTYDVIFSATDVQGTLTLQFRKGSNRKTFTGLPINDGLVEFAWKAPKNWQLKNTTVVATFVPASESKYTAAQVTDTVKITK